MKFIYNINKLFLSKTTNLYTLDKKIWKSILSSYESK